MSALDRISFALARDEGKLDPNDERYEELEDKYWTQPSPNPRPPVLPGDFKDAYGRTTQRIPDRPEWHAWWERERANHRILMERQNARAKQPERIYR